MTLVDRCGPDVSLLALGTCLVAIASGPRADPGRTYRWFGRNSYEVYLIHEFIVVETV